MVEQLRCDLEALRSRLGKPRSSRCDPVTAAALVAAIAESAGDLVFVAGELLLHAGQDAELRKAIAATGAVTTRQLGHVLRAVEGKIFGGRAVVRVGITRVGVAWMIREFPNPQNPPTS